MRTVFIGDSFLQFYSDTWIEIVSNSLGLNIVLQKGIPGGCEYYIYDTFKQLLDKEEIDLAIFTHTEPHRLVNPQRLGITYKTVTESIGSDMPADVRLAAKMYYEHLYDDQYHTTVHNLMIAEIQNICFQRNIKHVHIPSFNNFPPVNKGLWIVNGLHDIATLSGNDYYKDYSLRNHFTKTLHEKFAAWVIPHIKLYIDNPVSKRVIMLNKDDFK